MKRQTKKSAEYREYLKGKYYGMLRDYEKGWDYEQLLDQLLVEIMGAFEEFDGELLNSLYSKTSALRYMRYKYFRENVMLCMKLVDKMFV